MKKLGKKNVEAMRSVEGFKNYQACSDSAGYCDCNSSEYADKTHSQGNNIEWNMSYSVCCYN